MLLNDVDYNIFYIIYDLIDQPISILALDLSSVERDQIYEGTYLFFSAKLQEMFAPREI